MNALPKIEQKIAANRRLNKVLLLIGGLFILATALSAGLLNDAQKQKSLKRELQAVQNL